MKTCSICGQSKPVSEFYTVAARGGAPNSHCKRCDRARYMAWKSKNLKHLREYEKRYARRPEVKKRRVANQHKVRSQSPRRSLTATLAHAFKRAPSDNPATVDDLMRIFHEQEGKCALSGIVMTWNQGQVMPTSISIDRIEHTKGYAKDNVRLVCHHINAFRGQQTDEQMLAMARAIVDYMDAKIGWEKLKKSDFIVLNPLYPGSPVKWDYLEFFK